MSRYLYALFAESAYCYSACGNYSCGYPAREVPAAAEILKAVVLHLR